MLTRFLLRSAQTLDSSELQGDGIVLSLEEQLNALSLSSSPSPSGPDPKDTVALNGTRFASQLFEDTSESTKVGIRCARRITLTPTLDGEDLFCRHFDDYSNKRLVLSIWFLLARGSQGNSEEPLKEIMFVDVGFSGSQ